MKQGNPPGNLVVMLLQSALAFYWQGLLAGSKEPAAVRPFTFPCCRWFYGCSCFGGALASNQSHHIAAVGGYCVAARVLCALYKGKVSAGHFS